MTDAERGGAAVARRVQQPGIRTARESLALIGLMKRRLEEDPWDPAEWRREWGVAEAPSPDDVERARLERLARWQTVPIPSRTNSEPGSR